MDDGEKEKNLLTILIGVYMYVLSIGAFPMQAELEDVDLALC